VISIPSADSSHTAAFILRRWRVFPRWQACGWPGGCGYKEPGRGPGSNPGRGLITLKCATETAYFELDDCSSVSRRTRAGFGCAPETRDLAPALGRAHDGSLRRSCEGAPETVASAPLGIQPNGTRAGPASYFRQIATVASARKRRSASA